MLGMDEEAFAAGGQDPDTEASEFAVAKRIERGTPPRKAKALTCPSKKASVVSVGQALTNQTLEWGKISRQASPIWRYDRTTFSSPTANAAVRRSSISSDPRIVSRIAP